MVQKGGTMMNITILDPLSTPSGNLTELLASIAREIAFGTGVLLLVAFVLVLRLNFSEMRQQT